MSQRIVSRQEHISLAPVLTKISSKSLYTDTNMPNIILKKTFKVKPSGFQVRFVAHTSSWRAMNPNPSLSHSFPLFVYSAGCSREILFLSWQCRDTTTDSSRQSKVGNDSICTKCKSPVISSGRQDSGTLHVHYES